MSVTKPFFSLFLLLAVLLSAVDGSAQIVASTLPMKTSVQGYAVPSGTLGDDQPAAVLLVVSLDIEPEWYIYSNIPGETGKPRRSPTSSTRP